MSLTLDLSRTSAAVPTAPVNLSGLTRAELRQALIDAGVCPPEKAKMRASQVWRWIHHHGVTDFAAMTNIDKETRSRLEAGFTLAPFVAALGSMRYMTFLSYNVAGGTLWVVSLTVAGYIFGNIKWVNENLTAVIMGIIVLSLVPGIVAWLHERYRVKRSADGQV